MVSHVISVVGHSWISAQRPAVTTCNLAVLKKNPSTYHGSTKYRDDCYWSYKKKTNALRIGKVRCCSDRKAIHGY